jgi:hypothetical protein
MRQPMGVTSTCSVIKRAVHTADRILSSPYTEGTIFKLDLLSIGDAYLVGMQ